MPLFRRDQAAKLVAPYFEARSSLPETPDALDQRGVIGGAGAVVLDAVWRQAHDRALAALEMTGIVVVLGPAGLSGTFLQELMAGLRERGRAVTFVPRPDLPRWWSAGSALVIEDAAQMDAALLEAICRPPGRRIVLAGLPASALAELPAPLTPAPLTVVTLAPLLPGTATELSSSMSKVRVAIESGALASALAKLPTPLDPALLPVETREPLSAGTGAAPRSSSRSNARVAVTSFVLAVTDVFGARMAIASGVLATTCVVGALLWTRAPPASPEPAPSASEQPGDVTNAALLAPLSAGDEDRPHVGTSLELPPVPTVAEPAAPLGSAPQLLLPETAPIRVLVSYAHRSAAARHEAARLVRLLRGGGLAASDPAPAAGVAGKAAITYFFAEDRDGARRVAHDLGEGFGPSRLSPAARGAPLHRPGTIEVLVPR
jgi:hypothetical protein